MRTTTPWQCLTQTAPAWGATARAIFLMARGAPGTPLAREVFFGDFQSLAPRTLMARSARYQEKFYFNPGDTGFKIFHTKFATIGVAICWDQWFPEGARAMALQGAEARLTQPPQ